MSSSPSTPAPQIIGNPQSDALTSSHESIAASSDPNALNIRKEAQKSMETQVFSMQRPLATPPKKKGTCLDCCTYFCLFIGISSIIFLTVLGAMLVMESDLPLVPGPNKHQSGIVCFIVVGIYAVIVVLCQIRLSRKNRASQKIHVQ